MAGDAGVGVYCAVFADTRALCALLAGLQASPSKHTSYSVRMENAVPIVTQAPGAQPLQIQPGLLTQVGRQSGIARRWDLFMYCIIELFSELAELLVFKQCPLGPACIFF